ncbi:hypothetical protein NIES37_37590 [Tolypothrix tenuis PCC 7101]|uniref:Uncharacterized protein n=1 Tax=Tolypothrix tenuis PCC 7101 TaxID=231146 RepID=A0A1Z4N239_9CYAN|nr:hypothetical protein NIES37_37590 [Tolypothrix tenuis PCC 7101]BAZ76302.1 hypothetical protein NIES50_49000 [Aulosira laxa NIES-50]
MTAKNELKQAKHSRDFPIQNGITLSGVKQDELLGNKIIYLFIWEQSQANMRGKNNTDAKFILEGTASTIFWHIQYLTGAHWCQLNVKPFWLQGFALTPSPSPSRRGEQEI